MVRGIEKRRIVDDETDRRDFVRRLGALAEETMTPIYAWALDGCCGENEDSSRARGELRSKGRRGRSPSGNLDLRGFEDPNENFVQLVNNVPPVPRLAESIYSKPSEQPKTACQVKWTAPLALSASERRDPQHFARSRPLCGADRSKTANFANRSDD